METTILGLGSGECRGVRGLRDGLAKAKVTD